MCYSLSQLGILTCLVLEIYARARDEFKIPDAAGLRDNSTQLSGNRDLVSLEKKEERVFADYKPLPRTSAVDNIPDGPK
jgi:hypothetical protein